jgi:hypothetical protein
MKTLVSLLTLIAATSAFATSDFERFDKLVSKYATQLGGQPKALCLCREELLPRSVGYLLRGSSGPIPEAGWVTSAVSCFVPGFDENSGEQGTTFVCLDFVPIGK